MSFRRRTWVIAITAAGGLVVLGLVLTAARVPFSSETLRKRVITTLSEHLDAKVELGELTLHLFPELHAVGTALEIRLKGRRDVPPLISVKRFTVDASLLGLWRRHVTRVNLEGLDIEIPPKDHDEEHDSAPQPAGPHPTDGDECARRESHRRLSGEAGSDLPVRDVIVDEVVANEAQLVILPRNANKGPKIWSLHELHVQSVGFDQKMPFQSLLTNAVPPGEITTSGTFGPWHVDEPGETPVDGGFTFDHADLSVFRGISGILSAHGSYGGTLNTLDVHGETETPDFMVNISGHTVPLKTKYHAIVDGTNGDTVLEQIDASFLNTSLVARGGVYGVKGVKGRTVTLDITMDKARLEDVIRLAVKTPKAPMTGALSLKTKFDLPPGKRDVVEKLRLGGQFVINNGRFTDAAVQQQINELSRRARGKLVNDAPQRVNSDFTGRFTLADGRLALQSVAFNVPGAVVELSGEYGLQTETIAFSGNLFMDAKISQTTTGLKSLLLKMVDPLFRKNGRTVIPIKIGGTRHNPSFGLDARRVFKKDATN